MTDSPQETKEPAAVHRYQNNTWLQHSYPAVWFFFLASTDPLNEQAESNPVASMPPARFPLQKDRSWPGDGLPENPALCQGNTHVWLVGKSVYGHSQRGVTQTWDTDGYCLSELGYRAKSLSIFWLDWPVTCHACFLRSGNFEIIGRMGST